MDEILDPKTQLLVALAAATAAKCQNCFAKLYPLARNADVSDREVRAVVAVASKVSAKAHDFMTAFIEDVTKGAVRAPTVDGSAGSGCGCA